MDAEEVGTYAPESISCANKAHHVQVTDVIRNGGWMLYKFALLDSHPKSKWVHLILAILPRDPLN